MDGNLNSNSVKFFITKNGITETVVFEGIHIDVIRGMIQTTKELNQKGYLKSGVVDGTKYEDENGC
jgi:hypothetical protein